MTESGLRWLLLIIGIIILAIIYVMGKRSRDGSVSRDLLDEATQLDDEMNIAMQAGKEDADVEFNDHSLSHMQSLNALVQEESETRVYKPRASSRRDADELKSEEQVPAAAPEIRSPIQKPETEVAPVIQASPPKVEMPNKLVVLHVASRRPSVFNGQNILQAAEQLDLEFDARGILHRPIERSGKRQSLFSIASMVKPGIIPVDNVEGFATPGLTLFLQLPGPEESLKSFNAMYDCAQGLASLLDGDIQDQDHSAVVPQTIDHLREEIQLFSLRQSGYSKKSV